MRIGRIRGSCKQVEARKRLFKRGTAPGKYRVQFDAFRRFESKRTIETEFIVTVYRSAGTARPADPERERPAARPPTHGEVHVVDRAAAAPLHTELAVVAQPAPGREA